MEGRASMLAGKVGQLSLRALQSPMLISGELVVDFNSAHAAGEVDVQFDYFPKCPPSSEITIYVCLRSRHEVDSC